jgi:phage shock protein PspC (stress-responsive transcriptional regulator)
VAGRVSLEVVVAVVLTVLGAGMSAYLIWAVSSA